MQFYGADSCVGTATEPGKRPAHLALRGAGPSTDLDIGTLRLGLPLLAGEAAEALDLPLADHVGEAGRLYGLVLASASGTVPCREISDVGGGRYRQVVLQGRHREPEAGGPGDRER